MIVESKVRVVLLWEAFTPVTVTLDTQRRHVPLILDVHPKPPVHNQSIIR